MEGSAHRRGKDRLIEILRTVGYKDISAEAEQVEVFIELLGFRRYIFDIQAYDEQGWQYCFEVDGKRGHSSRWNKSKDKSRDRAMREIGIKTVRIPTIDLVGKKKQTDKAIIDEINYQLEQVDKLDKKV